MTRLDLIHRLAARLECRPIAVDGLPYLDRYYLCGPMPEGLASLWPEDARPRERLGWLEHTWFLHRFHCPDSDRHLHNHPWSAKGRLLYGSYTETRSHPLLTVEYRRLKQGMRQRLAPNTYHAITALYDNDGAPTDEVWTLFGTGPKVQSWGYLVDGEHVPWREYQAQRSTP